MAIYDPNSNQHSDGREQEVDIQPIKFYVDIPNAVSEEWINIDSFPTREQAIKFAQEEFGADEEGKVSLISQS